MRRLTVIRHAKSSWDYPVSDFERPLNERGEKNAPLMGRRLLDRGHLPDIILSSPAKRALQTAHFIALSLSYPSHGIFTRPSLYCADVEQLLETIQGADDRYRSMFLIGHNPGLTELCNALCDVRLDNLPTCGVFCIDFFVTSWKDVCREQSRLVFFDWPKNQLS